MNLLTSRTNYHEFLGRIALLALLVLFMQKDGSSSEIILSHSSPLQKCVDDSVQSTLARFKDKNLKETELAVTVVDLRDSKNLLVASYRGDQRIYPASVIKLFYLEAIHRWMEDGKTEDGPELRRAMRDMIVDSYNEATHYVLDVLTGTTSGPELPPTEMVDWEFKRNVVNRYFASRGFTNINANQKPWCEGPYGRDRIFVRKDYSNRNALTTDATAKLLATIALGQAVTPQRSAEMLELLKRDPFATSTDPDSQARGFTGSAVPPGSHLWSKAGWTSETRHDAAYLQLANKAKFVLVTFTVNHANERDIIPAIAREIIPFFGSR
jgi:hypothetical protein